MQDRGTVLVVGGSRGIGLAIARKFAVEGFDLFLVARKASALASAAKMLEESGTRVATLAIDATEKAAPALILQALQQCPEALHYAVISIGAWRSGSTADLDEASLQALIDTNTVAPHLLQRSLMPILERQRGGILFVGSLAGCMPLPWLSAYAASKAHLHASVLSLREEMHGLGVNVCLLAPGAVRTEFISWSSDSRWRWFVELLASTPETVAQAAYCGLRSDVPLIVPGVLWRLVWLGIRILPAPVLRRLSRLVLRGPGETRRASPGTADAPGSIAPERSGR
ncbi:MAG: SDR family NAD(P)-dependent oxidoreductase [Hyphomicrobiaceae bacterium]